MGALVPVDPHLKDQMKKLHGKTKIISGPVPMEEDQGVLVDGWREGREMRIAPGIESKDQGSQTLRLGHSKE